MYEKKNYTGEKDFFLVMLGRNCKKDLPSIGMNVQMLFLRLTYLAGDRVDNLEKNLKMLHITRGGYRIISEVGRRKVNLREGSPTPVSAHCKTGKKSFHAPIEE